MSAGDKKKTRHHHRAVTNNNHTTTHSNNSNTNKLTGERKVPQADDGRLEERRRAVKARVRVRPGEAGLGDVGRQVLLGRVGPQRRALVVGDEVGLKLGRNVARVDAVIGARENLQRKAREAVRYRVGARAERDVDGDRLLAQVGRAAHPAAVAHDRLLGQLDRRVAALPEELGLEADDRVGLGEGVALQQDVERQHAGDERHVGHARADVCFVFLGVFFVVVCVSVVVF